MNGQKFTPRLKAGGLWAKTSAKGGRYLTGRLGGVKVLILANKDRQSENDPSHILYFVDGEQRRQGAQEHGGGQRASQPSPASQTPPQPQCSGFQGHQVPGHQAPLHRDGQPSVRDVLDDAPEWAR
jgi:hypothetical protein